MIRILIELYIQIQFGCTDIFYEQKFHIANLDKI